MLGIIVTLTLGIPSHLAWIDNYPVAVSVLYRQKYVWCGVVYIVITIIHNQSHVEELYILYDLIHEYNNHCALVWITFKNSVVNTISQTKVYTCSRSKYHIYLCLQCSS